MIAVAAVRTGVVGGRERADDELTARDRSDLTTDILDDAAVFMAHRGGSVEGLGDSIGPEIRPADARDRHANDRISGLHDCRVRPLLEFEVPAEARTPTRFK